MNQKTFAFFKRLATLVLMLFFVATFNKGKAQDLPFEIENNSVFPDDQVYIALLGRVDDQSVWLDVTNGEIHPIDTTYNTIQGPDNGSPGAGGKGMYADCFRKLSNIPNSTIDLPQIASVRIFMSFNEQLYLYFFGDGGYSGPDLANETDPNQGIRFEIIELTYNDIGIWVNTTRVDHYQYPMGLEVWGDGDFYKKVGEVLTHQEIIDAWKARVPEQFQICLDEEKGIIQQPSKLSEFKEGGIYYDYFDDYVDQIWDRYMDEDLTIGIGDAGSWVGRVDADGETFRFERASDGRTAIVEARPNTQEIMEGKGVLAHDVEETPTADDLDVQKHFCAAFTRGVIDPDAASGEGNDWSNEEDFFQDNVYNEYVKFWHSKDISYEGETYAFCYDDVFDYSSTVHTTGPTLAKITIGGFADQDSQAIDSIDISPESVTLSIGETQQFTAVAYDSNGVVDTITFSWSSNAPDGLFTADATGDFTITASAEGITTTATVIVSDSSEVNLALGKSVVVSSIEGAFTGENAVDGNMGTRWATDYSDSQWIYVDLGQDYSINKVVIEWETAMASDYDIQVSEDTSNWTTIRSVTGNSSALNEETDLDAIGRYVRINGTARATNWGYSIWELQIYGEEATSELTSIEITPNTAKAIVGDQQTFIATGYDQFGNEITIDPTWNGAADGVYTAQEEGVDSIMASYNGISGYAIVTVASAEVESADNLALNQPVTVSSNEDAIYPGSAAVDGDEGTRWSSEFSDPQWLYVDLGQTYDIDKVVVLWEAAMASDYEIQVSEDTITWNTVRTVTGNTDLSNEEDALASSGRYVRIYGTSRVTGYGYSIKELEVYSSDSDGQDDSDDQDGSGEQNDTSDAVQYFTHYEAEDYTTMSGVGIEDCDEGGSNVGWIDSTDWMNYSISVPVDGEYTFTARISSDVTGGGSMEILEDGISVGSITIASTGGWQAWSSLTTTVNLTAGTHTLQIKAPVGGWNFNWFEISNDADGPLYIPLHIEYCQYLRLGFSPTDEKDMSELITQNISRDTSMYYNEGTTFTIELIEKRRSEDIRFYTFNDGDRQDTIQSDTNGNLTVTAYKGIEVYADFIEIGDVDYDPIADAGNNDTYDLAEGDCYTLNGTSSFDPDGGTINAYSWAMISGPDSVTMSNVNGSTNRVCGLVEGEYQFELTVTDDEGVTGTDIIIVTVIQEQADFALSTPLSESMFSDSRRPEFTWENVDGATRYDVYVNVSKEDYDWYASGNLLDRYTKVGESTTNSFTMPYDLVDRWTYKWYVQAITDTAVLVSNIQQFGVYIPYLEEEDDGVSTADGYRDMNKNGTMEPFENWMLTPEERLEDLMSRLSVEEMFKQCFYGGGEDAENGFNFSYGVEHIMKEEQYAAAATTWGIPMAHAGDKIHGWKTIYPTQLGLAATRDPNIAYQCGNMQRVEQKSFGFAGTLTPLAEVDTKVLYPRFQEGNGENAEEASAIIRAIVCGMQGGPEINPHSMLITVKHWPGQGAGGEGPTQYDEKTIGYHMKPWYAMVEANAASIMPGYSTSPFLDPTEAGSNSSKPIIDYLRDVIGFDGFIVTDWLAATTAQSIESMSAGIDVLGGAPSSGTDVDELVASIGSARLEQACRRVLDMKIRLGMFENPYGDTTATWTNEEHHEIALNAARKSITLIKNDGVLPISSGSVSQIGVAGPRATWASQNDDPNVIWQSIYYENPQAMDYVEAFASRATDDGITVISGQGTSPDVAVVVIGEQSYTHGTEWEDKDPNIPEEQLDSIRDFADRGIPVITVVISPRPYVLTEVVELSSAVMLVYRGGNGIAQATAELCFGDYNPSGKLPFQLPRSQDQIGTDDLTDQVEHWELPYDIGATDEEREEIINLMANDSVIEPIYGDPLFQYGYGIEEFSTLKSTEDSFSDESDGNYGYDSDLKIFPNPVLDRIYVRFYSENQTRVDIYSLSGQLLKWSDMTAKSGRLEINVADLESGYYLLKASTGDDVHVSQFIKQ